MSEWRWILIVAVHSAHVAFYPVMRKIKNNLRVEYISLLLFQYLKNSTRYFYAIYLLYLFYEKLLIAIII